RLAEMRKATFWSREQPAWSLRWSTLELAARLMRASEGVRKNIKKLGPSTAEMVRAYAQFSAPWMMVDRLHRHWESRLLNVDPDEVGGAFDFERLAAKIRHQYAAVVDDLNRALVVRFEESGFEIAGWLPQTHIFAERVVPALREGSKTAYLLVDALRYEMGAELVAGLGEGFEVGLEAGIGVLPSITIVGMAALLPGGQKGLELAATADRLAVTVGGHSLKDRQSRMAFLAQGANGKVMPLKLAEVLRLGSKRKKELAEANLIVVTSQEIDRLGEEGD